MRRFGFLSQICLLVVLLLMPIQVLANDAAPASNGIADLAVRTSTSGLAASSRAMATGEHLSNGIDAFTSQAAAVTGDWITREAFLGISWFKLFSSLIMLLLVVVGERLIRYLADKRLKTFLERFERFEAVTRTVSAVGKPVSLFVLAYGAFWAMSPLYPHFKPEQGVNLVYLVAAKAADLVGCSSLSSNFAYEPISNDLLSVLSFNLVSIFSLITSCNIIYSFP